MKKKIITSIVLTLLLATMVVGFGLGDFPQPELPHNLLTQVHEQYGMQLSPIVFEKEMNEEPVVICNVKAINNDFHIKGGRADCVVSGEGRFQFAALIEYDYDSHLTAPDTFIVSYIAKDVTGEERIGKVEVKRVE